MEELPGLKNHSILKRNFEILSESTNAKGEKINAVKLPMPGYVKDKKRRYPASYSNFYIGNTVVLVPIFGHENDKKALNIIQSAFPKKKIIGINCTSVIYGLGAIHCISQQQPKI